MRRLLILLLLVTPAFATRPIRNSSPIEVLIDGAPTVEYAAYGTRYIEAVAGRPYSIRLRNPLGVRVAVALSVDGLSTIDARHTEAVKAQKWVLEPYETVTITGWQTSQNDARRFFFTTEQQSYAKWMGKTEELGTITAVFFREQPQPVAQPLITPDARMRKDAGPAAGAAQNAPSAKRSQPAEESAAATGIGERVDHRVERIHMELENRPFTVVTLRYEYRPQLVKLGILPAPDPYYTPRERKAPVAEANGFCPQP